MREMPKALGENHPGSAPTTIPGDSGTCSENKRIRAPNHRRERRSGRHLPVKRGGESPRVGAHDDTWRLRNLLREQAHQSPQPPPGTTIPGVIFGRNFDTPGAEEPIGAPAAAAHSKIQLPPVSYTHRPVFGVIFVRIYKWRNFGLQNALFATKRPLSGK